MLMDSDPSIMAMTARIEDLKASAMERTATMQARANACPDDPEVSLRAHAAELMLAATDLASNSFNTDELRRMKAEYAAVTDQAIENIREERTAILDRYPEDPEHAMRLCDACVSLEFAEVIRSFRELLLCTQRHQEQTWQQANECLKQLAA